MRKLIKNTSVALVAIFICACQQPTKNSEYILFHGGTILTVDSIFSEAESVVIKDSLIVAIGSFQQLNERYGKNAEIINLHGKTMLPGFIDPHAHSIAGSAINYLMEYIGMARFSSTEEVLNYLKETAKNTPEGEWICGRNWDPSVQDGVAALTFKELDSVSTQHPVFIINASGHLAYANSKAYEIAGITEDIVNPDGAEFVRDNNNKLTGVMKNMVAFGKVWAANPRLDTYSPVTAITTLLNEWNEKGITTTTELALGAATTSVKDAEILFNAAKSPDFTARIRAYPSYIINEQWNEANMKPNTGNALARIVGFKLVADGSNQGYTGLQREPYCCGMHQGHYGKEYTSVEALTKFATERAKDGWQLAIHGNGDAAIDNILTVMETLDKHGYDVASLRPRIEHCSILHDDQIEKMRKYGVSASFLIGHVYYWGAFMRDEVFGHEKVQLLDRCASVENSKIGYTLHSDFMVTNPDPLEMIEIAVNRNTWKDPEYKIGESETVSVESAIIALTSEAAWQVMSEHEIGSIEKGKYADLVILEEDPRKVEKDKISEIRISQTWMNGKIVYTSID